MRFKQKGFTLIEAMVAIVILTMSLFATYSWVNVSIEMLVRSDVVMAQELLVDELLDDLSLAGPDVMQGEIFRDNLRLVWRADALEVEKGRNNLGSLGYFDHTLFEITADVYSDETLVATYRTRQVRSVQTREPSEELSL